jgi:ADP-ribose pyrophosphatase YjhB (NUDIX family)
MKTIIASGPVIIENGKLLVSRDFKDDFYKLPGGRVKIRKESLEHACKRRVKEEVNGDIEILKPLYPQVLWKNPTTKRKMIIILINYLARLKNKSKLKPGEGIKEIKWIDIKQAGKYRLSPNTKFTLKSMGRLK